MPSFEITKDFFLPHENQVIISIQFEATTINKLHNGIIQSNF